ncbi:uncharacterized protein LOC114290973 [Camellia sinensis]|uniref:uncharacterized protein LOC114290973 n=1 Tax=Camellia sinensis TaxID=4442 RepID=UPI001035968A|nr:uncharacterized protein LOC114290973 [Camellia sinensis]
MRDFNVFIESCELTDIPMIGRKFTWCNAQKGALRSKTDRFLLDPEWIEKLHVKLWGLPKIVSDHCPILLMEDERDWGPKPFRFLNAWTVNPTFSKVVRKVWEESQITGWGGFIMPKKLQQVKYALKRWNCDVFGVIPVKLQHAKEKLHEFDLVVETRELSSVEKLSRRETRDEVWKLSGINSSVITLVLKKDNPISLGDYRPISLIGVLVLEQSGYLGCRIVFQLHEFQFWAKELNLFKGVVLGSNEISVSHLQFADNSIIFVRLACKCQKLPFKYLGLPLRANPGRLKIWKPIVDRFKVKLASWKRRFLSLAGRLTLIKAVLSSLPVCCLSLFKMPKGVAKELDKIQAAFLWGGSVIRSKLHMVKWFEVTRFGGDENLLWKKVLCEKYNIQGSKWYPNTVASSDAFSVVEGYYLYGNILS